MFNGNPLLRGADEKISYTKEMQEEFVRCMNDIIYFGEKYCHIITLDAGKVLIKFWDFQKKILKAMVDPPEYPNEQGVMEKKKHICILASRQISKTTLSSIFILHYAMFNKDKTIAVLANKEKTALEIMQKIKMIYENLPLWLQNGLLDAGWSKSKIEFANGSRIIASSTSSTGIRGFAINCLTEKNIVTIRDKVTEEIKDVSILELKNLMSEFDAKIKTIITNSRYEIMTPSGFKDFDGLYQSENKKILKIETNEEVIELTEDHEIFYDINSKKSSKKFNVGDEIVNKKCEKSKITKITKINKKQKVYDLLNVRDEHRFFCNNLLVSNCLFLDEFSFVNSSIAEEFMASVYPTISSGKTSKIIIVSTPNGLNHFYNIWSDAIRGKNQYFPIKINWFDRPDRDETFKENVIKDIGTQKWLAEYQCIHYNSLISIRDVETGRVLNGVKVGELYKYGKTLFD